MELRKPLLFCRRKMEMFEYNAIQTLRWYRCGIQGELAKAAINQLSEQIERPTVLTNTGFCRVNIKNLLTGKHADPKERKMYFVQPKITKG